MRFVVLGVLLIIGVLIWAMFVRRVRAFRHGRKAPGSALKLTAWLIVWILAFGYSVGYAAGDTRSAGAIGLAVSFGATIVGGPIVRFRETQRRAKAGRT